MEEDILPLFVAHPLTFVVRVFQGVNDLPPTGELDEATLEVMRQPRCGLEDPFNTKFHKYRVMGESGRETLVDITVASFYQNVS